MLCIEWISKYLFNEHKHNTPSVILTSFPAQLFLLFTVRVIWFILLLHFPWIFSLFISILSFSVKLLISNVPLNKVFLYFSKPYFPHLKSEDDNVTYFLGILYWLSEIMHVRHLDHISFWINKIYYQHYYPLLLC